MTQAIQYQLPDPWLRYEKGDIQDELLLAQAHILALKNIPFQRRWVQELQAIQLKLEIGGSSQIEGADFAADELERAIKAETPEELQTRSQKQAHALSRAYDWISELPDDLPITSELICEIHRQIVTDCEEDHCPPGKIRTGDNNVYFGVPVHRGVAPGDQCQEALDLLANQAQTNFRAHHPLVQALALHYYFAAMHPFADGNGRTARALEALMLQRAGLRDSLFIAMSNYYYDEKRSYLKALAEVREKNQDLTPFLKFGLKGIAAQTGRLAGLLKKAVSKEIFRSLMHELFVRLESTRKRVIVKRQLILLEALLNVDGEVEFYSDFVEKVLPHYLTKKIPLFAIVRDVNKLIQLGAILVRFPRQEEGPATTRPKTARAYIQVNLDWPMTLTESEFFAKLAAMPRSKSYGFLHG